MGVNALQAAMVALNALNTQRETLRNEHNVRLHGIMTQRRSLGELDSLPT